MLAGAMLLAFLVSSPPGAAAQARGGAGSDERERAFVESVRREDPAAAERYVALRDGRAQAIAELERVQSQYSAAGPELRVVFLQRLRQARRTYAERSLALIEFLDERDRRALASYEEEIRRLNAVLEQHAQARAELEKLLRD